MSDSLFHFVFPFLAILASGLKMRHRILVALILASLAVVLDVDHFFGLLARGTFHNIFVTLLLPIALFGVALKFEKKGTFWKTTTLMAALVLFSHPAIDLFVGSAGVHLFYPASNVDFLFNPISIPVTLPTGFVAHAISSEGIGFSIFFLFVLGIIFAEDLVKMLTRYKSAERALEKTVVLEEKKLKKNL